LGGSRRLSERRSHLGHRDEMGSVARVLRQDRGPVDSPATLGPRAKMSDNGRVNFDEATHTYRVDGVEVPGVSAILGLAGLEPAFSVDPVTLALAAERGLGIHRATAIDDRHGLGIGKPLDPETIDPEFLPYLNAWRMFRVGEPWVSALNG